MKRLHFALALAGVSFFACGGDDGGDDGADSGNDSTGTATDPTATDPTATDPTATDPTATDPTATDPTATDPTATDPTVSDSGSSSDDGVDTSSDDGGSSTTSSAVTATANLEPKSGSSAMGTATFTDNGDGTVDLVVELTGVEPAGMHGLHIHEFPDCSAEDGTSAGMHWNPKGTMLGELGNVDIAEDGTGTFMKTDAWSIGTGETNDVLNHSIVIHLDPDGGDRIACGVIEAS